jgi:hypothetical protein
MMDTVLGVGSQGLQAKQSLSQVSAWPFDEECRRKDNCLRQTSIQCNPFNALPAIFLAGSVI